MSLCIDVGRLIFIATFMVSVLEFTTIINQLLPEPHAGLLNGILFGTKAMLSRDLYNQLVKTGTLHIIALSGMNITILTNLVSVTLLRFVSRRIASLLTVGIIIGFILFVGVSASVIRAGIMGSTTLLAVVFGRQAWSLLSLILAVSIMLIAKPLWISDIGFQLSVLATLGIILFSKKTVEHRASKVGIEDRKSKLENEGLFSNLHLPPLFSTLYRLLSFLWSLIEDDLRITLAAQVFTIPILLFHFHRISLVSPFSNVLIGWVIAPVTVLGLVTIIAGWVWLPLGQVFAWITWVPLQYVLTSIWITSMLPFASFSW